MSDEVLVKVEGVSKKFCRSFKRSLWYGVQDIVSDLNPLGRSRNGHSESKIPNSKRFTSNPQSAISVPESNGLRRDEFWAVNDVSFELKRGECLGLIGRNGAGKTTLLKMLNGLIKPDKGRIEMRGRVGALIALGAGFNPILTGRENIYVNSSVLGLTRREIGAKIEDIIDFADIGDFVDTPVQSYSSGMQVRLGFAVATALQPEVLLVDEVLAVGDIDFRTKCYDRLEKMRENLAIILVSHNRQDIARMCASSVLIEGGRVQYSGGVEAAMTAYERGINGAPGFVRAHEGFDLLYAKIDRNEVSCGDKLVISIGVSAAQVTNDVNFRMSIMDFSETGLAEWRSEHHGPALKLNKGENHFTFVVDSVRLRSGAYFCNFIFSKRFAGQYLLLAFRHQELTVNGETTGLCPYQL